MLGSVSSSERSRGNRAIVRFDGVVADHDVDSDDGAEVDASIGAKGRLNLEMSGLGLFGGEIAVLL